MTFETLTDTAHDTLIDILIAAGCPAGSTGNHARCYPETVLCELIAARLIRIATSGIVQANVTPSQFDTLVGDV
jgi:hypothetical protein